MDRTILHADCNSFFASVEEVLRPELKNVPMAVCGDPESRKGIILAKNQLAKGFNINTAETIWQAKQKCPALVLVAPHHGLYGDFSRRINEIYQEFTDQVEPFGIDESFLDVTGSYRLFGSGMRIANILRARIYYETGLTISVGVSFNKTFAKLGSDYKKPNASTKISRENFKELLWPLPVGDMMFVGKATKKILEGYQIRTIGDLAGMDRNLLIKRLGKSGAVLHDRANGIDPEPVRSFLECQNEEPKSISHDYTFAHNLYTKEDVHLALTLVGEWVAARLRSHRMKCYTVQVRIKDPDLKSITRQCTLEAPTNLTKVIVENAVALVDASWKWGAGIRMLSVGCAGLVPQEQSNVQMTLFGEDSSGEEKRLAGLDRAVDDIRHRFGKNALMRAVSLERNLLEDFQPDEKQEIE